VSKKNNYIFYLLGIIILLLIWETVIVVSQNDFIFPTILQILKKLLVVLSSSRTYLILLKTLSRGLIVLAAAVICGIILALLSYKFARFELMMRPGMTLLKALPIVAIIVILLFVVGNEYSPYLISFVVALPLIYEGMLGAYKSVPKDILDEIATQSTMNFVIIKDIFIPLTIPSLSVVVLQTFALTIKVMVMAEFVCQPRNTIGSEILLYRNYLETATMYAWIFLLIVIVIVVECLIHVLNKKIKEKLF
jgi:NitT/TauT family transport system permease protein